MAYDPDRLGQLLGRLRDGADELRRLSCTDPAAATAMCLVRATTAALEFDWIPLVARVLTDAPLSRSAQGRAGLTSLSNNPAYVMATQRGWSVQVDPLADDTTVVTIDEARALAARLNGTSPDTTDHAEMQWLAQQLAVISRDPALSAVFLADFEEWATLADHLADRRLAHLHDDVAPDVDAVFVGLGGIARHLVPSTDCATPQAVLPGIDEMRPYSAALLVQYLGLDGVPLAQIADHVLQRWVAMPFEPPTDGESTDVHWPEAATTGDILFSLLLTDPVAGHAFVHMAADHPDVLFSTARDRSLTYRLVLSATDPARHDAADAGAIVLPLLEYFARGDHLVIRGSSGYAVDWPVFLVDLITPWTMQFSPQNSEFTTDTDRKERLLAFVVSDPGAVGRLLANADEVQRGVLASLGTDDVGAWSEFAAYLGVLARSISTQRVRDEEAAAASFGMMLDVVGLASGCLLGGALIGSAVGVGLVGADRLAPYDPNRVAADASYAEDCLLTTAAAAVAGAVYATWLATGALPPGFPHPPTPRSDVDDPGNHFVADLREWTATLPAQPDGRNFEAEINGFTGQVMGAAAAAAYGAT